MITNELFPLTGFTEDKKLSIYGDDYSFNFMDNNAMGNHIDIVKVEDNCIRGYTHFGKQIALMCDKDLSVNGYHKLYTQCVFQSTNRIDKKVSNFNKITFNGGVLNNLLFKDKVDFEDKGIGIGVTLTSKTVSYDCSYNEEKIKISISYHVSWSDGTYKGAWIKNSDVSLSVHFSKMKPFSYAIKCYYDICNCIRFMTNRYNVGFDEIIIATTVYDNPYEFNTFNMYVDEGYGYTEKDGHRCITFNDLGESFGKLYELFATSTDSNMKCSLGFCPQDDQDVYAIGNNTIRSICSALEFEAEQEAAVQPESNPILSELITSVRNCVKKYRNNHSGISESTYSRIFTSMNYWSFSAKDKIQMLWNIHEEAMRRISIPMQRFRMVDIAKFVKYRNSITHGAEKQVDEEVANTAIVLRGLVYCCVLKRIGINEDKIIELCEHKLNS